MCPGHTFEHRGANSTHVAPGYLSFNNSANQIGHYIWSASSGIVVQPWRTFLAGGLVQPTNEFYISADSNDCMIVKPNFHSLTSAWTNLSPTSVVLDWEGGNYYFGGTNNSVFALQNRILANSGANKSSPMLQFVSQYWTGSATATDTLEIQAVPGTGANPTVQLNFNHVGSSGGLTVPFGNGVFTITGGGNTTLSPSSNATSGANVSSPFLNIRGNVWHAGAAANDTWTLQNVIGAGTDPTTTLTFGHAAGGSGIATISLGGSAVSMTGGNLTINGSGQFTSIAGITPQAGNAGVAILQHSTSIAAQTANIVAVTFSGASTLPGKYRVSGYIEVTQTATTSSTLPDLEIIYTNTAGTVITRQATTALTTNSLGTYASFEFVIRVGTTTNIQYATGQSTAYASSGAQQMQYGLSISLEFLG